MVRWRSGPAPPALAALGVGAATVAVVRAAPGLSLAGDSPAALAAELAAVGMLVAAALVVRPPSAPWLVAAACAWLVAEWNSPGAGVLFTVGLVGYAAWPALLVLGVEERPSRPLAGLGLVVAIGVLGLASALVFDPAAQGCSDCPRNLLLIAGSAAAEHTVGQMGLALAGAWVVAAVVAFGVRLARASPVRRRLAAPVVVPAALAIGLFGADAAHGLTRGYLSTDPTDRALRLAQAAALALIAAGLVAQRLRLRRTRARAAQLVLDIGAAPAPGQLREHLALTLGDPDLALLHRVGDGWIDQAGRATNLPEDPERAVTLVRAGEEDVLAIAHRRGLLDDPQLVEQLATTARLAVDHERLQAARLARLEELRASRGRIVAAADRERRTLERDLHDGAQQRLVTLGISIRLARRADPEHDRALAAAEEWVRAAVVDLREVAHGLFPTVLGDEGLAAALDVLSEQAPRLVAEHLPDGRFPDAVESAAYFAALEALRLTDAPVTVAAAADDGYLRLEIGADVGAALVQIQDRVGAAGGTVTAGSGKLLLEMPCGS